LNEEVLVGVNSQFVEKKEWLTSRGGWSRKGLLEKVRAWLGFFSRSSWDEWWGHCVPVGE
jgi:hypothetical protein